jgi:4-cresol dehydrogenase (hydroxylating) flavoprotein subunit
MIKSKETGMKDSTTAGDRAAHDLASAFTFLPSECVIRDAEQIARRYRSNVTALSRTIPLALRPGNAEEIAAIIAEANQRDIPLYPFSTGKNWGMGSKLPVLDGGVVLDLSQLNRILDVNEVQHYAVLEPGVTQAQLAEYLARLHPALSFNLTGNVGETSIVGNTLERGDGSHARIDDLIGLGGILGNGKPFEVGGHFGMGGADTTHVMRYAAGADLVGLFTQSNFGVITRMVFRLRPRAQKRNLYWGVAENAKLSELFDRLHGLYAQRIISNPAMVNVGYENRFEQARSTLGDKTADTRYIGELWNFYILFDGSATLSRAIFAELHEQLDPCCLATGDYESGGDPSWLPPHLKPLVRPLTGHPDNGSLRRIYELTKTKLPEDLKDMDADQLAFGMKSHVAVIPPVGEHARKAADLVAGLREQWAINIKPSFFGDGRFLVTIHFDRTDPQQVDAAEQGYAALWERLTEAGYMPYRVGIDQMKRLMQSRPDFFALVKELKAVLDPKNIIAPGRYCPA